MAVGAGKFKLFSKIDSVLSAGEYRYIADHELTDDDDASNTMPIDTHHAHVRVRAPRYLLPPDQALSTFPPANTEGSYGSRLPQVVIKRRTLPWERDLEGEDSATPWMALVLIAEGEASLVLNQPVAECVTPGVELSGVSDVELGNSLHIKESMVRKIFPTRKDVPLLAHGREVDINDTELMMGDDDGMLSVVIANRVPLGGVDGDGEERPVKYLACLVNLEGQFERLIEQAPKRRTTVRPVVDDSLVWTAAQHDHVVMTGEQPDEILTGPGFVVDPTVVTPLAASGRTADVISAAVPATGATAYPGDGTWTLDEAEMTETTVYAEMASDFSVASVASDKILEILDTTLRFPVLLHWSFVSTGDTTFESLMRGLDSGLIGTVPDRPVDGREPLEVVETGHVGLVHRTRHGDAVRGWYRGPLTPHPQSTTGERLPLAHVSDQLRLVIPDGREDLSWASAFEIGRMLALAHPSMIAALLQWRQTNYHVQRQRTIWDRERTFLDDVLGVALDAGSVRFAEELGRGLIRKIAADPDEFVGPPRSLTDPGRPLEWDAPATDVVGKGFGLGDGVFVGDLGESLESLKRLEVLPGAGLDLDLSVGRIRDDLHRVVDNRLVDLVSGTLDLKIDLGRVIDGGLIDGAVIDGGVIDGGIFLPTVPGTVRPPGDVVVPFEERITRRSNDSEGDG